MAHSTMLHVWVDEETKAQASEALAANMSGVNAILTFSTFAI